MWAGSLSALGGIGRVTVAASWGRAAARSASPSSQESSRSAVPSSWDHGVPRGRGARPLGRGRRGDPPRQRPYAIPDDRSEDQTLGPRNGALDVKRLHQANSAVIKLAKNIRPLLPMSAPTPTGGG